MAVKHGKGLTATWAATPIGDVTNWNLNDVNKVADYASSSTAGETKRVAGVNDSTGSFSVLSDTLPTTMTKGASGALVLTSDGSVTVYTKTVRITDINFRVDVNGLIQADVSFGQA